MSYNCVNTNGLEIVKGNVFMVTKNNQRIIVEDAVTSERLSVSILNYVKVVYKLRCAIKVSGCDYNYYYLDKCFRLKKKACQYRIGMFLIFRGRA